MLLCYIRRQQRWRLQNKKVTPDTLGETCAFSQLNNFVPTGKMWWSSFSYFRKMCGFTRDHFFLLGETDWVGKWCLSHQSCSLFMQHKTTPNKTRFDLKVSLHAFKLSANRFMSRKIGYLSTFHISLCYMLDYHHCAEWVLIPAYHKLDRLGYVCCSYPTTCIVN